MSGPFRISKGEGGVSLELSPGSPVTFPWANYERAIQDAAAPGWVEVVIKDCAGMRVADWLRWMEVSRPLFENARIRSWAVECAAARALFAAAGIGLLFQHQSPPSGGASGSA